MERGASLEAKRQRQAHYATIVGAAVTAGSMVFGVLTYQRSAAHQRQAESLAILQEYLKLAIEHPDLASRRRDEPVDASYEWFATHALFTAETLLLLVGDDPRWTSSVASIVRQHQGYIEQGHVTCGDFTPEFVTYMRKQVQQLKCADQSASEAD